MEFASSNQIPIIKTATILLGAPIGRDQEQVVQLAKQIIEEQQPFFDRLTHPAMTLQCALLLLRSSGIPRFNYLARVVNSQWFITVAKQFDQRIMDIALRILKIAPAQLTEQARDQLLLPLRLGGLGLRSAERTSPSPTQDR